VLGAWKPLGSPPDDSAPPFTNGWPAAVPGTSRDVAEAGALLVSDHLRGGTANPRIEAALNTVENRLWRGMRSREEQQPPNAPRVSALRGRPFDDVFFGLPRWP
jgi:hypothetical protein